jgi:HPt (histidine-containing phosphotransfer) domain-containing protein
MILPVDDNSNAASKNHTIASNAAISHKTQIQTIV